VVVALTAIALFLCWQMVAPFLPAFAWALALSMAVYPLRSRLIAHRPRTLAATVTVFIALVMLAVPGGLDAVRSTVDLNTWRHAAESNRFLKPLLAEIDWLDVDLKDLDPEIANRLSSWLMPAFTKALWAFSQVATFLFAFFFFVKDQESMIEPIRSRLPRIRSESDYLFVRITDAIHAAVYGRVLIGTVQGIE
jgi:predicted PurR-regulated permease PerM